MNIYPPAPWKLKGNALQTIQLVDIERVRSLIPAEVDIIPVFPGKTIGGVGVVQYGAGSVLEYSELVVVSAIARYKTHFGAWISHIYVDSEASVAGGRNIWGLPKELAEFRWVDASDSGEGGGVGIASPLENRRHVTVSQSGQVLCRLQQEPQFSLWRQPLILPNLRWRDLDRCLLYFQAQLSANLKLNRVTVEIPSTSPFANLSLDRPWLAVSGDAFDMLIPAATEIGQSA